MDRSSDHRLFIALPLPIYQQNLLANLGTKLRQNLSFANWIDPRDYHLTIQFLGSCSTEKISSIKKQLSLVKNEIPSFHLRIDGLDIFGSPQKPRVLWAKVAGQLEVLHQLQSEVSKAMEQIGFTKEHRPYRPHITLAKKYIRKGFSMPEVHLTEKTSPKWQVDEIILYRTQLKHKPRYEIIARFPLLDHYDGIYPLE